VRGVSRPPEPPQLPLDRVHAIIDWADTTADWLRAEMAEAERRGHQRDPQSIDNLRLYEGVAVLFREAYDTRMDEL